MDPLHFRKINWLQSSDRVEYYTASTILKYWIGIVLGYIKIIYKPSLWRYSTRAEMALDMPLKKTNTGQKSLSFLGQKIWSKIDPSTLVSKMLKHRLLSCMLFRKISYFIYKANSQNYHFFFFLGYLLIAHSTDITLKE